MNICGCLIHIDPRKVHTARPEIEGFEGAEIHAETGDGRFVVVVEDTETRRASEIIMDLHQIPGVISLTLNFHHFEDLNPALPPDTPKAGGQTHDHI